MARKFKNNEETIRGIFMRECIGDPSDHIGKDFIEWISGFDSLKNKSEEFYVLALEHMMSNHMMSVVKFLRQSKEKDLVYTGEFWYDNSIIKFSYFKDCTINNTGIYSLLHQDAISYGFNEFIFIGDIIGDPTCRCAAKDALDRFKSILDGIPIFADVALTLKGEYEEKDYSVIHDKLVPWFRKQGFVNVNDRIGTYKFSVAMMCPNKNGFAKDWLSKYIFDFITLD